MAPIARTVPSPGRCIYCGAQPPSSGRLTDEHIIPEGLDGNSKIIAASCAKCQEKTSALEGKCLSGALRNARVFAKIRGKKKKRQLRTFPIYHPGSDEPTMEVEASDYPEGFIMVNLPPPTLLVPRRPDEQAQYQGFELKRNEYHGKADIFRNGIAITRTEIDLLIFARFLAKVAHCNAVAKFGLNNFKAYLPPLILGETDDWAKFVGGFAPNLKIIDKARKNLHTSAQFYNEWTKILTVEIQLFSQYGTPTYTIHSGIWTSPILPGWSPLLQAI